MRTVIFDLDGTLCDVEHRRKYVTQTPKNWDAFNKACVLDKPNKHVMIVHDALVAAGVNVFYVSGRSDEYRAETLGWLQKYCHTNTFHDMKLTMRRASDRRSDDIVKLGILNEIRANGWDVIFTVDDRDQVVNMWRANGIPCFQCAPGDF